jgi:hypothetical protein
MVTRAQRSADAYNLRILPPMKERLPMRHKLLLALTVLVAIPAATAVAAPTAEERKDLEKLFTVMDTEESSHAMMEAFLAQAEKQALEGAEARGGHPEDVAEAKELFVAIRAEVAKIEFAKLMRETYVEIYAKYFSPREVRELLAFYATPTGKKSLEVMSSLVKDGAEAGGRILSPEIEQAMARAMEIHAKKYPWRRTMSDMRSIASAVEAYAIDNDEYPLVGDYAALEPLLVPDYMTELPMEDMWGHAYAYTVSPDGQQYRVVSAGSDSIFDWDSRRIAKAADEPVPVRYRDRLEDDFIYADGQFVQLPRQAKPRDEE